MLININIIKCKAEVKPHCINALCESQIVLYYNDEWIIVCNIKIIYNQFLNI